MTKFDTARVNKNNLVVSREIILRGPIISVRVPSRANQKSYPQNGVRVPFFQFERSVRGGKVNLHLHSGDVRLLGTNVTATATLIKKRLSDGREYLYIDLVPTELGVRATHRLVILDAEGGTTMPEPELGHNFLTPAPVRARIMFAAKNAVVVE